VVTEPLRALIRKYESDGAVKAQGVASAYDVVSAVIPATWRTKAPLTTYPVGEILEWQAWLARKGVKSTAAGAYQVIRSTLTGLLAPGVIFDVAAQDAACDALLDRRGWGQAQAGTITPLAFADRLSREWASLPVQWDQRGRHRPVRRGQSYYAGDGLNAAHCPPEDVLAAVIEALGPTDRLGDLESRVEAIEQQLGMRPA
jgi:hypothetical protein